MNQAVKTNSENTVRINHLNEVFTGCGFRCLWTTSHYPGHHFSCRCPMLFHTEPRTIAAQHNIQSAEILKNASHSRAYKYFLPLMCLIRLRQLKPNCTYLQT